jgi:hypothetical protein
VFDGLSNKGFACAASLLAVQSWVHAIKMKLQRATYCLHLSRPGRCAQADCYSTTGAAILKDMWDQDRFSDFDDLTESSSIRALAWVSQGEKCTFFFSEERSQ